MDSTLKASLLLFIYFFCEDPLPSPPRRPCRLLVLTLPLAVSRLRAPTVRVIGLTTLLLLCLPGERLKATGRSDRPDEETSRLSEHLLGGGGGVHQGGTPLPPCTPRPNLFTEIDRPFAIYYLHR